MTNSIVVVFFRNVYDVSINVTRYSKRNLTALPTSYWFGINTFSHKRAAVFSSQEVHDIIGCKVLPQM